MTVSRGETVVADGQILNAADVERLEQLGLRSTGLQLSKLAATALFAAMVGAAFGGYLFVVQPRAIATLRRLVLFALLLLTPVLAAKFGFQPLLPDTDRHFLAYAVPLAAAPIAAAVLLDVTTALLLTLVLAAAAAFVTVYLPEIDRADVAAQLEAARMWLAVAGGSLAGVYFAANADRLQRYLAAGLASAAAVAAALLLFWLLDADRGAVDVLWIASSATAGGVLAALIAVGAFVLLSRPFGIITRVELMELAQLNHRLLRRLQDEAPGTFQHSILVGNLAERAADRIGANALLVRVGAYYHDVGKLASPEFFVENLGNGENPHDGLDPLQSTRVIHQHVSGGLEMARREGLPEAVVQFIPQHHGTRLMTFFYRRAAAVDAEVDPELFRYPGPKPRSRETALVMLADASEAAVRADDDRSAERIREIVEGIVSERIEEGEFDECGRLPARLARRRRLLRRRPHRRLTIRASSTRSRRSVSWRSAASRPRPARTPPRGTPPRVTARAMPARSSRPPRTREALRASPSSRPRTTRSRARGKSAARASTASCSRRGPPFEAAGRRAYTARTGP